MMVALYLLLFVLTVCSWMRVGVAVSVPWLLQATCGDRTVGFGCFGTGLFKSVDG